MKNKSNTILWYLFLILCSLDVAIANPDISNIDTKIKKISQQTHKQNADIKNTYKSLNAIYQDIRKAQKQKRALQIKLNNINARLKRAKRKYELYKKQQDNLVDGIGELRSKTKELERQIEDDVVEGYTKSLSLQEIKEYSVDEVIDDELYNVILEHNKEEGYKLNKQYLDIKKKEITASRQTKRLSNNILQIQQMQKKLSRLQDKQNKILATLKNSENAYKRKIAKKRMQQRQMLKELSSLNILKSKTIEQEKEKQRELIRRQRAKLAAQKLQEELKNARTKEKREEIIRQSERRARVANKQVVVQRGSSVSGVRITTYRGARTIAPLRNYRVLKEFGKHRDRLYNTELFEESITLSPTTKDRRVRSVFDGVVAFVKQNHNLFGNVIIIKHSNSIATVYAHLSQISSSIYKGKRLSKGDVIAISGNSLKFQVLQNGKYVNPRSIFR